ncbi:FAD-binding oxidoreductase [Streptomyces sp. ERV7]|uniref:FAD-binding oxidoreductase n=1 Tax=Streptomyces sp. ERV7 TaxID=1322334 RepID=UPI000ABB8444|nr:FAD-binding oxidoreductase [Streptomyces sp. ERV7]
MRSAVQHPPHFHADQVAALTAAVRGPVLLPGQDGHAEEGAGFNTLLEHRPALVVGATGAADVAAAVRFAAAHGLPVAVQATGHGAARAADGAVLVSTRRMTGLRIAPDRGTARIAAGVLWEQVIHEGAAHGLAPLNGSSPLVGAVSYALGGGLAVMARTFGYAADHIRGIDVVTADGVLRQVDEEREPELFWGLCGGKGNFGVVTSMEIGLMPVRRLYGGALTFDGAAAPAVLRGWLEWTALVPGEMTSSLALVRFPDDPALPAEVRGRFVVQVRIAFTGAAAEGARLVAPLRELGERVLDTVREMPYADVASIHGDPTEPYTYHERTMMLGELDRAAAGRLLAVAGPDSGCPLGLVELRHLGGALRRPVRHDNAVGNRDARYCLLTVAPGPRPAGQGPDDLLLDRLAPWATGGKYLNFLDSSAGDDHVRAAFTPEAYTRLAALKARYDPANVFRVNHNIAPAALPSGVPA